MSHYVIGYHDLLNNHYEICEYADDAYNAIKQAREDLPNMKASPLSCEYCIKEDEWELYLFAQQLFYVD